MCCMQQTDRYVMSSMMSHYIDDYVVIYGTNEEVEAYKLKMEAANAKKKKRSAPESNGSGSATVPAPSVKKVA